MLNNLDALHPEQFAAVETPLEHYGIRPVEAWQEKHLRKTHPYESVNEVRDVPISKIRGGQHYVDTARVHEMARSGENDLRESETAPAMGTELPTGEVMLGDGHHRTAALALRGEKSVRVRVDGRYLPHRPTPYDPKGLHSGCE